MRYFTLLTSFNKPKNKMQVQIWEFMYQASERIIDNAELFLGEIQKKLDEINSQNPRCNPMKAPINYPFNGSIIVSIKLIHGDQGHGLSFAFYPVKEDPVMIRKIPKVPSEELTNLSR
jgi:hypothetical protein